MSKRVKPINKKALLGEFKGNKVYVDPKRGKVSNKPTPDSVPIPRTIWFSTSEEDHPLFSIPEVKERIANEAAEMALYFPDFDLYQDESGALFWLGKIDGIGEMKITYPQSYPSQKFTVEALDQLESFNEELQRLIWSYDDITPVGALIVTMRFFLLKKNRG